MSKKLIFILLLILILNLTLIIMFDFQKLEVYKKAKLFHRNCKLMLGKQKQERYVNDQLGRASFSIVLNIAEGSGKAFPNDRKNYFTIARASIFECVAILDVLHDDEGINHETYELNLKLADELSRMLYKMIANLSKP
nr:four helix bundle protein [Chitinophagaceae bacterium]